MSRAEVVHAQLRRMLRPKMRRWAMYEWFYAPMDYGWFRHNPFMEMLQAAGLGHVTELTRIEWSFVRTLFGRPRRLSAAFLLSERARLERHRREVRALRPLQAAGATSAYPLEAELGLHGPVQVRSPERRWRSHPTFTAPAPGGRADGRRCSPRLSRPWRTSSGRLLSASA